MTDTQDVNGTPTEEGNMDKLGNTPSGRFVRFANKRTAEKAAELGTTPQALRMALAHRALGTTPTDTEEIRVLSLLPRKVR